MWSDRSAVHLRRRESRAGRERLQSPCPPSGTAIRYLLPVNKHLMLNHLLCVDGMRRRASSGFWGHHHPRQSITIDHIVTSLLYPKYCRLPHSVRPCLYNGRCATLRFICYATEKLVTTHPVPSLPISHSLRPLRPPSRCGQMPSCGMEPSLPALFAPTLASVSHLAFHRHQIMAN